MQHPPQLAHRRPQGDPESGIVLLMVVFLTFLLLLSLAIAAPRWAHEMQRQKDIATIHYGEQYERAIQLYYRRFHRYPTTVKELLDTNDVRFLRQQYKDPLTGKDDWKLVLYGHAHVHPLGLFGKPLSDLGTMQASGGMYAISGDSESGNSKSGDSGPSAAASARSNSMGLDSSSGFGSSNGFGSNSGLGSSMGGSITGSGSSGPDSGGGIFGNSNSSALGSPTSSDSGFHTNLPFVGVVPPIKKKSVVDYRAQDNYDRWEFNYDPVVDMLRAKVSILGGKMGDLNGATSIGDSGNNSLNGSGNMNKPSGTSSSPFGESGIFGNSGSSSGSGNANSGNGNNLFGSGSPQ